MIGSINNNVVRAFQDSFELLCQKLLVEGYNAVINDAQYSLDWKEDSFTNYIANFMRRSALVAENYLFIKTQVEPENDNLPEPGTENDPSRQPRIDIWIANFTGQTGRNEYYIEAKNLCENDWFKASGTRVSSTRLKTRYVDTGIENFKSRRYPKGCLAGYVLEGTCNACFTDINVILKERGRADESLIVHSDETGHSNTFLSTHSSLELKHFFFKF